MRICVAIKAKTTQQSIQDIIKAEEADLIELRLDYRTEMLDLKALRKASEKPLIATNRRHDQGGATGQPEPARVKLLLEAVEAGFELVDLSSATVELGKQVAQVHGLGGEVIASHHDFKHALNAEELARIHRGLADTGCDIVKIIGWADSYEDNLSYLEHNKRHPGNICFAMSEKGIPSRILAPLAGAAFTYASLDETVAPGQTTLKALRSTYRSLIR